MFSQYFYSFSFFIEKEKGKRMNNQQLFQRVITQALVLHSFLSFWPAQTAR